MAAAPHPSPQTPVLRLFVLGQSETVRRAIANARTLGPVEVIDVRDDPGAAEAARILATPTLIRTDETPARIVGDLRDLDAVRAHLGPPYDSPVAESEARPNEQ